MSGWRDFSGFNAGYVLELYERYRRDPSAVDDATRALFERWTPPGDGVRHPSAAAPAEADLRAAVGAANLASAIRAYGHLAAHLDPLGSPPPGDPWLDPATHGVTDDDLARLPASLVGGPVAARAANALEAIRALRGVYCGTIGFDAHHVRDAEEREWLRDAAESGRFRPPAVPVDALGVLRRLTEVETFERFLHRVFPGKTRFSIEGLDMLVPMLDEILAASAEAGIRSVFLGMAHRGRLNVLAHVLHKPYEQILAEFRDPLRSRQFREDLGWTGDVTYHKGGSRELEHDAAATLLVTLAPNPSHLEAVDPVVQGMAYAAASRADAAGAPRLDPAVTLPVLIHGDASFPGQGVVAETLNLSRLPGYAVGGTVHIIANNQLGFTTVPTQSRSTWYASDLARGFEIPIVHVNADDPEACLEAARLAFAYRARFRKDVLIDLVGYRRWGHNEGDEPSFTQPLMYRRIERHPTVRARWAEELVARGAVEADTPGRLVRERTEVLRTVLAGLQPERSLAEPQPTPPPAGAARRVQTAVPLDRLRALLEALLRAPEGFALHPKLARALEQRRRALDDPDAPVVDWATAELLAFASVLEDGIPIRLAGQDTSRGTFSQRHAVFRDTATGRAYVPLQALPRARAAFEVVDTPLSENAALAFEYGYNIQAPQRFVLWEAQYGDFLNGAQVVIDEFLTSGRAKWGQTPSLVLLLPHGHEGQGPDHSSARPERILQLAAETNLRLANATTAAQYFHLLRRQAALLGTDPLPLFVLTPKSLLRHPLVASSLRALAEGEWRPVLDDPDVQVRPERVRSLLLCSGKIAVELATSEHRAAHPEVAILRVEQLYLFPVEDLREAVARYPAAEELVWVQEEPENMGAWTALQPLLREVAAGRPLRYVGRPANASPAEGSMTWHAANQASLIARAFGEPVAQREAP